MKRTTIEDRRLTDEEFFAQRKEVLSQWKTGKEIEDLDEVVAYCQKIPDSRIVARQIDRAMREGRPLISPRSGAPTVEIQLQRDLTLQEAGADVIGIPTDAHTQISRFDLVEEAFEQKHRPIAELLNGLPCVNIGAKGLRWYTEQLSVPSRANSGILNAGLVVEVTMAAGFTEHLYGAISGCAYLSKDFPLDECLRIFQYVDRLTDYYAQGGVDIVRMLHGHHTVTHIPSITTAQSIIESLLLLTQQSQDGRPRYLNIDLVLQGDLIQDVAVCRSIPEIHQYYFKKFGYDNVIVNTEACQWSGMFPEDEGRATAINCWQTAAATWGRAAMVVVKSSEEAVKVPGAKSNAMAVTAAMQIRELATRTPFPWEGEIPVEAEMFKKEVMCIVDRIIERGEGDKAVGLLRACETGELDHPYLPSRYMQGRVRPARDNRGAMRILDPGNLPFTKEILEYNREKLAGRVDQGKPFDYRDGLEDIMYFAKDLHRKVSSKP